MSTKTVGEGIIGGLVEAVDMAKLMAENNRLRSILIVARQAINSLPEDALGYVSNDETGWPIQAQLLHQIDGALSSVKDAQE